MDWENTQESDELELNFEILQKQKETTTSMADLYGYSVFSAGFQKKIEKQKEAALEQRDYDMDHVFHGQKENNLELAFQKVFAAKEVVIIKEDYKKEESGGLSQAAMISFMITGALLAGGIWMWIEKRRKEKRLRENNHNHA